MFSRNCFVRACRSVPVWLLCGSAIAVLSPGWAQAPSQGLPLLPAQMPCDGCAAPLIDGRAPAAVEPAADQGPAFRLTQVQFHGAQAVPAADLQTLAQPYLGRDVRLGDLQALAQAVTALYHERGYFLAQAQVPVQTVRDGVVLISVSEGRIAKAEVFLAPEAPISEARVQGFLAPVAQGRAVSAPAYERAMLLLSDQPGLRVGSSLQDSLVPGELDLSVDIDAAPAWRFSLDADNYGSQESGRYRIGGTARWASPLGLGDNLDLRAMFSNGQALQFGRLSYELPLGTQGLRAGVGISHVNYELGGALTALGAQGNADVADVSISYPVIRQRQHNLFLRLAADSKRLKDEFTAVDFAARKRVQGIGLGWTWELRDGFGGGGYWASAGHWYHGQLSLSDAASLAADQAPDGRHTDGGFSKLTFQFSRLQTVLPRHVVYIVVGGQRASKNLDPAEKLALGGARAVRAYASGEVLVDEGLVGSLEWRWAATSELTPFVFYDAARGVLYKRGGSLDTGSRWRSLRGAGLGLNWSRSNRFAINASLAWRSGTPQGVTDGGKRGPRLYVQGQMNF